MISSPANNKLKEQLKGDAVASNPFLLLLCLHLHFCLAKRTTQILLLI